MLGDGLASRDFCHVADVYDLIVTIGTRRVESKRLGYNNVGSGMRTTLLGLFRAMREGFQRCGVTPLFDTLALRPWLNGDILHSAADITAASVHLCPDEWMLLR